jgi:hypothetical protein
VFCSLEATPHFGFVMKSNNGFTQSVKTSHPRLDLLKTYLFSICYGLHRVIPSAFTNAPVLALSFLVLREFLRIRSRDFSKPKMSESRGAAAPHWREASYGP